MYFLVPGRMLVDNELNPIAVLELLINWFMLFCLFWVYVYDPKIESGNYPIESIYSRSSSMISSGMRTDYDTIDKMLGIAFVFGGPIGCDENFGMAGPSLISL